MRRIQLLDRGRRPLAAAPPRRAVTVPPLVEPARADRDSPARGGVRDAVLLPLVGDEARHRYRPTASSTQRAALRLRPPMSRICQAAAAAALSTCPVPTTVVACGKALIGS